MAQLNISVPEGLKSWADFRVAEGFHSSTSDYVRDLMRRDMADDEARRQLQSLIDDGRNSGRSDRTIKDIIAAARVNEE